MSEQEDKATISRAMALLGSRTSSRKRRSSAANIRKAIAKRWAGRRRKARKRPENKAGMKPEEK